ncbi:hypothetical protein [Thermomonospora catenispora]|uniref:hypothetical protein n=1 Tax=Thermomonospora catenispora TaxID=2493090 RepID=UPI00111D94EC|nr:hypothetical protein [Thermomonospora catenispora]TNY38854.1 hypothetical protein EIO00_01275 [Thermomonospora catenispora]
MLEGFPRLIDDLVRAAVTRDQAFGDLFPRVMQEAQGLPPAELTAALPAMAEGIAQAPPNLGCWLAVMAGAWVERGASPEPAGLAVIETATGVAAAAHEFANAWQKATGSEPPDPEESGPSQEIVDTVGPHLEDPVAAMLSWFAMPQFTLSARTMLATSPMVRGAVSDRERRSSVFAELEQYFAPAGWTAELLRVLDGERLLVLDRASRRGWTVTISGIGDNFQLHTLLGGALVGHPDGLPGEAADPRWISCFTSGEVEPGTPPVVGWWNLVDAHGDWIWNEGVPADIPAVNGTRVVVLDPPSYQRSWNPGRRHPLMTASLTVEGQHTADDLAGWWAHIAEAKEPAAAMRAPERGRAPARGQGGPPQAASPVPQSAPPAPQAASPAPPAAAPPFSQPSPPQSPPQRQAQTPLPPVQLNPIEQMERLEEITVSLLDVLPAGWRELTIDFESIGRFVGVRGTLTMSDGSTRAWSPPHQVLTSLDNLRTGMYAEGRGTWFSCRLSLTPPGRYTIDYDRQNQPSVPATPEDIALEQRRFPRSPEHMPDWYRTGLANAESP